MAADRIDRPVLGWREWVALPDLGVAAIRAKVDTGARSAALHVLGLELGERDDAPVARFVVDPEHRGQGRGEVVEAAVVGSRYVRNPGGRSELRPLIRTTVRIGPTRFTADVTLTRRDEMGFPLLLGRQAIRRRFLVDPGRSYLVGTPPDDAKPENRSPGGRKGRM